MQFELRYNEVDRARGIFERYVQILPTVKVGWRVRGRFGLGLAGGRAGVHGRSRPSGRVRGCRGTVRAGGGRGGGLWPEWGGSRAPGAARWGQRVQIGASWVGSARQGRRDRAVEGL